MFTFTLHKFISNDKFHEASKVTMDCKFCLVSIYVHTIFSNDPSTSSPTHFIPSPAIRITEWQALWMRGRRVNRSRKRFSRLDVPEDCERKIKFFHLFPLSIGWLCCYSHKFIVNYNFLRKSLHRTTSLKPINLSRSRSASMDFRHSFCVSFDPTSGKKAES